VTISDISPANFYESQILANFKEWKGRRIVSYKFPEGVNYEKLEEDRDRFINQHSFFVPLKKKLFDKNAQIIMLSMMDGADWSKSTRKSNGAEWSILSSDTTRYFSKIILGIE
jgi:hypothetical protein